MRDIHTGPCIKLFQQTAAIFMCISEIMRSKKPNFELFRDINESDACMKLEQKPLRTGKVIVYQRPGQMDGQAE